jgi:hypothetical protein
MNGLAPQTCEWSRRTDPIKWTEIESITVDQIAQAGDLDSVLFYMDQLATAEISEDDSHHFTTPSALNAFMILQLGADYLIQHWNELSFPDKSAVEQFQKTEHEFSLVMARATKAVADRDAQIRKLQAFIGQEEAKSGKLKALLEKGRNKVRSLGQKHRRRRRDDTDAEPGAINDTVAMRRPLSVCNENRVRPLKQAALRPGPKLRQEPKPKQASPDWSSGEVDRGSGDEDVISEADANEEADDYSDA